MTRTLIQPSATFKNSVSIVQLSLSRGPLDMSRMYCLHSCGRAHPAVSRAISSTGDLGQDKSTIWTWGRVNLQRALLLGFSLQAAALSSFPDSPQGWTVKRQNRPLPSQVSFGQSVYHSNRVKPEQMGDIGFEWECPRGSHIGILCLQLVTMLGEV